MNASNVVAQLESEHPAACLILTSALKDGQINIDGTPEGFRTLANLLNKFADIRDAKNVDVAIGINSEETAFLDNEGETMVVFQCVDAVGFKKRPNELPRREFAR